MSLVLVMFNGGSQWLPSKGLFALRRGWLRLAGIKVGHSTRIASGTRFYDRYIEIGEEAWIGPEVSVFSNAMGRVVIGDRVDIGPRVIVVSGTHVIGGRQRRAGKPTGRDIRIGNGTWIGANSTILPGARIGQGSLIAGGSVVVAGDYPPNTLLAGVPARFRRVLEPAKGRSPRQEVGSESAGWRPTGREAG